MSEQLWQKKLNTALREIESDEEDYGRTIFERKLVQRDLMIKTNNEHVSFAPQISDVLLVLYTCIHMQLLENL